MGRLIVAAFVVALVPGRAAAQGQPAPPSPPAEPVRVNLEVVVTPERGAAERLRVPAATTVLEGGDLPALPAAHASEILPVLAGFTVTRAEFHAGRPVVAARGFFGGGEAEYIRLLMDGIPVSDVESGLIDWSRLAVASISRVEAVRGPAAAMYGDSAVGGVVQIFTDTARARGTASLLGGTFATALGDMSFGRARRGVGYSVSGAARRTDGAFAHSGGYELAVNGSADVQAAGWRWNWRGGADAKERDDPGAVAAAQFDRDPYGSDVLHQFDRADRRSGLFGLTADHMSSGWAPRARLHLSLRGDNQVRTVLLAPGFGDRRARELDALQIDASVEGTRIVALARPVTLRFGTDVARDHLDVMYRAVDARGLPGSAAGAAAGVRLRGAAFATSTWQAARRVTFSGALRWDRVVDHDFRPDARSQGAWSPRAGVVVQIRESAGGAAVFAQGARAFKVPTLDQLFDPRPYPDFRGGTFTISNSRLVPQRARNAEVGVTGAGVVRWTALAYRMDVEDEIDFDLRTFSYGNIGSSTHTGVELDVEGQWWRAFRPTASYALTRVTANGDSRQLKNVPRRRGTVGASADLPWAVGVHARLTMSGGVFLDDENARPLARFTSVDMRVRRAWGATAVFVDLFNATNRAQASYGFTLTDFAGRPADYLYPDAPRAWRVGVSRSF